MDIRIVTAEPISVIGKEGVCTPGHNIAPMLWEEANSNFQEVAALAKKGQNGTYAGFWGLMSDLSMRFLPWDDDFMTGLYLAGVEVEDDCPVPVGWKKWTVPGRTYMVIEIEGDNYQQAFRFGLNEELPRRNLKLSGAVCDHTAPDTGRSYLFFPCERSD